MGGFDLFIISGIDGKFDEFEQYYEKKLLIKPTKKFSYNNKISFHQNICFIRNTIESFSKHKRKVLIGWSIGAVSAAFLSNCTGVETCIMINPFYNRYEVLKKRGIICDENVLLDNSYKRANLYVIIRGELDDKIPPSQSDYVFNMYSHLSRELYSFPLAKHNISTFPIDNIIKIINNKLR